MRISVDGDVVSIEAAVRDPVAASMLGSVADDEERAGMLADMLEVGARVLQRQQDGAQGDLLRREVERMREAFASSQRELVDLVGSDFAQAVSQVMTRVSEQLASIGGRLDGALAVVDRQQEVERERAKGTAKGRSFEERVAEEVDSIARHCGDVSEHVGFEITGASSRAGDVVVLVGGAQGPARGRIVFEAKTGRLSRPEAIRELDRALEARSADYAVLVVDGTDRLPSSMHELREVEGDKLVVALDDDWSRRGVEVAYSLARARVLASASAEREGADVGVALAIIEQAQQILIDVRTLKARITGVVRDAEEIREIVDSLFGRVRAKLAEAQEALEA